MSFWSTQYKHAEIARTQNKRAERLLKLEIGSRRGIKEAHRFNIQTVEHEQRLIERELERIRKGLHKKPLHQASAAHIGMLALYSQSHVTPRRSGRQENRQSTEKYANVTLSALGKDNDLFSPFVSLVKDRDLSCDSGYPIPRLAENFSSADGDQRGPERALALPGSESDRWGAPDSERIPGSQIAIDPNVNDSWQKVDTHTETRLEGLSDLDNSGRSISRDIGYSSTVPNSQEESDRSRGTTRGPRRITLDISQLAYLDMKSVKSNVSRRLSEGGKRSELSSKTSSAREVPDRQDVPARQDVPETGPPQVDPAVQETKPKDKPRKKSRAKLPAVDSHKKSMDFDPEHYNPDGSIRKVHNMPTFEKSWEQATKARYIRSKETAAKETELTVEQIFDKKTAYRPT